MTVNERTFFRENYNRRHKSTLPKARKKPIKSPLVTKETWGHKLTSRIWKFNLIHPRFIQESHWVDALLGFVAQTGNDSFVPGSRSRGWRWTIFLSFPFDWTTKHFRLTYQFEGNSMPVTTFFAGLLLFFPTCFLVTQRLFWCSARVALKNWSILLADWKQIFSYPFYVSKISRTSDSLWKPFE